MPDLWSLPSAMQFLAEVPPLVRQGGALVVTDASTPPDMTGALRRILRDDFVVHDFVPDPRALPLSAVAEALGMSGASVQDIRRQDVVLVVDGQDLPAPDQGRWGDFLGCFLAASGHAAVLYLTGTPPARALPRLEWGARLRWADAMIWAEYAVPAGRRGLVQKLAVDLAVELCGWRLDLIPDLVSQREEDIIEPMGWLERNRDRASLQTATFGHAAFACPLQLLVQGDQQEIRRRIWAAHLSILFPWIEDHRQRLIQRYGKHLRVDQHLRNLGVETVEDIELGAVRWQLSRLLNGEARYGVDALARMRNDLAHRKPVRAADLAQAMRLR